jgi:alpha-tubulin suppressor-like RCC1 family protein
LSTDFRDFVKQKGRPLLERIGVKTHPSVALAIMKRKSLAVKKATAYSPTTHEEVSGNIYSWGSNERYAIGHGFETMKTEPSILRAIMYLDIAAISAYNDVMACITKDGKAYTCGNGENYQLGTGNQDSCTNPTQVTTIKEKIVKVSVGFEHTLFLGEFGTIYAVG